MGKCPRNLLSRNGIRFSSRGAGRQAIIATVTAAGLLATGVAAHADGPDSSGITSTPIKHLVVLYDEKISFDHYFGDLGGMFDYTRPRSDTLILDQDGSPAR